MSTEVCNGWQYPKGRSKPAENVRSDTGKAENNQGQDKADRAEDENILGKPRSATPYSILCLSACNGTRVTQTGVAVEKLAFRVK